MDGHDLRQFQDPDSIQDAFAKIVSGKSGYKPILERRMDPVKCKCGNMVEGNAKFCASCGAKVERKSNKCKKCNTYFEDNDIFCKECGTKRD
jgi:rRNA maturation endonuclease Nob1